MFLKDRTTIERIIILLVALIVLMGTCATVRAEESPRALNARIARWASDLCILAGAGPQYEASSVILSVEWALSSCVDDKRRVTCSKRRVRDNLPLWATGMAYALSVDAASKRPASPEVRQEMERIAYEMRVRSWLHRSDAER